MKRDIMRSVITSLFYAPLCFVAVSGAELGGDWRINRIAVAGDDLWLAAETGVVRYDKATGLSEVFPLEGYESGSWRRVVDVAAVAGDDVWVACGTAGVAHYDGVAMTFSNEVKADSYRSCDRIVAGSGGTMWAALGYGGFWCYDGESWTQKYQYGGSDIYSSYHNTGLVIEEHGTPWWTAIVASDGFGYCDAESGWVSLSRGNPYLNGTTPQSLAIDGDGSKWIGCNWPQIIKYDLNGDVEIISLTTISGDGDYAVPVYEVQIGPDSRVWGCYKSSLYSVTGKDDVECIDIPIPDGDAILSFKHDGDAIWIGTREHGLYRWAGGELTHLDLSAGIADIQADDSVQDDDAPVYDIMGRRVEHRQPGQLYIRAGKKFVE